MAIEVDARRVMGFMDAVCKMTVDEMRHAGWLGWFRPGMAGEPLANTAEMSVVVDRWVGRNDTEIEAYHFRLTATPQKEASNGL